MKFLQRIKRLPYLFRDNTEYFTQARNLLDQCEEIMKSLNDQLRIIKNSKNINEHNELMKLYLVNQEMELKKHKKLLSEFELVLKQIKTFSGDN